MRLRVLLCLGALVGSVCAVAGESELRLLPKGRPFRPTFPDPREIRMALGFSGDGRVSAIIGNYFSLLAVEGTSAENVPLHFGLEGAGYFTMSQSNGRFPLETADGLIGLYAEGRLEEWRYQLRYTHVSAHLADGISGVSPIPYSRETLISRVAYAPSRTSEVYGGVHWVVNSTPRVEPLQLQVGGYWFLPSPLAKTAPFVGADLKWRRESTYDPSFAFQAGIAINDPPEAYRSFRIYYGYYTGADPRGQFYQRQVTSHSLGVEMQI